MATVIETSDFEWCLSEIEASKTTTKVLSPETQKGKFLLIIVNLSCIEVIMHLEEQKLEHVLENSELLVACFSIIESSVQYMANDRLSMLEDKQKSQIYTALKNAFSTVLKFIHETSINLKDSREQLGKRQVSSMIHSARSTASSVVNIDFNQICLFRKIFKRADNIREYDDHYWSCLVVSRVDQNMEIRNECPPNPAK